jgi:16S rRNA (guanine527-N7)-methyltransferase
LTAVRDAKEMIRRHFAESLFVASRIDFAGCKVADIGSGAGFPGFPIAVVHPTSQVTLIESVGKKAAFLKEVSRDVPNVSVRSERFEQVAEAYDWAVLRAVAVEPLKKHLFAKCKSVAVLTRSASLGSGISEPVPWDARTVLITCST